MDYNQTIEYLYSQVPMFHRVGSSAYKDNLENTYKLDNHLGHPHQKYKTIHVGGTNGKGSVSNFLCSILMESGYKVGLYTSPHIVDFKERIRVNGKKISEEFVVDFVEKHKSFFEPLQPSFFELITAMCFEYFAQQKVDIAVIEVGMGGRLDCTNIINPLVSVVTNISLDHTQFLGNTIAEIAKEKAGITKKNTPLILGESNTQYNKVFFEQAELMDAPIILANNKLQTSEGFINQDNELCINVFKAGEICYPQIKSAQTGIYQYKNIITTLATIEELKSIGLNISKENIYDGFKKVNQNTGFYGRWQTISNNPLTICDTGHNEAGIKLVVENLSKIEYNNLRIVIGFVSDKDIEKILKLLPKNAIYYFVNANIARALNSQDLKMQALNHGLMGESYQSVKEGLLQAQKDAKQNDLIFVGGSNFVVAEI